MLFPFRCHATRWILLQCQWLCVHKHSGQAWVFVFKIKLITITPYNLCLINTSNNENILFVSLQFAVELAELLQHPAPKEWQAVAEYIKIPFDEEHQYHPEYDGYIKG